MMDSLYIITIISLVLTSSKDGSAFDVHRHDGHHLRIQLEEDEALILPRKYTIVRQVPKHLPSPPGEKYYQDLPPLNKKPLKYIKQTVPTKLKPSVLYEDGHSTQSDPWYLHREEYESNPYSGPGNSQGLFDVIMGPDIIGKHEDVKPVTEDVKDDIKYDFRTRTHSI